MHLNSVELIQAMSSLRNFHSNNLAIEKLFYHLSSRVSIHSNPAVLSVTPATAPGGGGGGGGGSNEHWTAMEITEIIHSFQRFQIMEMESKIS
jgi:hypothetical protein